MMLMGAGKKAEGFLPKLPASYWLSPSPPPRESRALGVLFMQDAPGGPSAATGGISFPTPADSLPQTYINCLLVTSCPGP